MAPPIKLAPQTKSTKEQTWSDYLFLGLVKVKLKIVSHLHLISHHYPQISISIPKSAYAITSATVMFSPFNNTAGVFSPAGAFKTNFSGRIDVDLAGARVCLRREQGKSRGRRRGLHRMSWVLFFGRRRDLLLSITLSHISPPAHHEKQSETR